MGIVFIFKFKFTYIIENKGQGDIYKLLVYICTY